jgi:hypothetical protein
MPFTPCGDEYDSPVHPTHQIRSGAGVREEAPND